MVVLLVVGLAGLWLLTALVRNLRDPDFIKSRPAQRQAGADAYPHFREIWSSGQGTVKAVRIPLTGMIVFDDRGWAGSAANSASSALRSIRRATADPDVRGLLLEIDSGGGGITVSDILHQALQDFRAAQPGRMVVVLMGDVAASGAYYIAAGADRIVAYPTTITGSIGVLIQTINVNELAERWGIRDMTIKSGDNKDLLNPLAAPDDAQRQMLQTLVDALHDRFVSIVADSRNLSLDEVRTLADGRVYLAEQALALGLIDQIGYSRDAEQALARLLDEEDLRIYRYEPEFSFMELFRRPSLFGLRLDDLLPASELRLQYRWSP